jgi:drug/metabolite transporter (DMT)-like permease
LCADYLLPVLFLAVGPGFVGHTGLNAVLKYSSSLIVAMAVTLEPPIGIVIGWILHVTPLPGYVVTPSSLCSYSKFKAASEACVKSLV